MAKYGISISIFLLFSTIVALFYESYIIAGITFVGLIIVLFSSMVLSIRVFEVQKHKSTIDIMTARNKHDRNIMWLKIDHIYQNIEDENIEKFNKFLDTMIETKPDYKESVVFDEMDEMFPELDYRDFSKIFVLIVNHIDESIKRQDIIESCNDIISDLKVHWIFRYVDV